MAPVACHRFAGYDSSVNPRPGLWWTLVATATVLSAAFWLRAPANHTLVFCGVMTALSIALTFAGPRAWNRIGFSIAAAVFVVLVAMAERSRAAFAGNPISGANGRRRSRHGGHGAGARSRDRRAAAARGAGARRARGRARVLLPISTGSADRPSRGRSC